jgi:glycosyltransferase involved in cell wall biosynthesis
LAAEVKTRQLARRQYDRVLIHREVSPFSSGRAIEQVAGGSALSAYDFDDALMWSPRSWKDYVWSRAENCQRAVAAVTRVIAGNEALAEWAQQFNPDVRLIPSCVEPSDYVLKSDYAQAGVPRLVWLGSPSTEPYLGSVADALLEVHRVTAARLTVISSGDAHLGPLAEMVDRIAWQPGIERSLGTYDLAISPLVNGPWERGKCAYKALQYAAAGLPTVISPVGANAVVAERLGLVAARTSTDWVDALVDLLRSSDASRRGIGVGARQGVERHYSFARWASDWLDAIGEESATDDPTIYRHGTG